MNKTNQVFINGTVGIIMMLICITATAQKPKYVTFTHEGKTGIMDTLGNVFVDTGTFGRSHLIVNDFKEYILTDNLIFNKEFFFDANTGEGGFSGRIDGKTGALKTSDKIYYHFWEDGESFLVSSGKDAVALSKRYQRIEPNEAAWSNENLTNRHLLWALKDDWTYDVLVAENSFQPVENLPEFTSFDLLFESTKDDEMQLIGFVFGSRDAIDRRSGQMYDIPESDEEVNVYNIDFQKIGVSTYHNKDISLLFGKDIQRRGSLIPPPQIRYQPIYPEGKPVVLNDEFALIPHKIDSSQLVLVNTKKNNEIVLGIDKFDYRYFSTSDNPKALLQIRHRESNSIFFFDFDGRFFPRGMPMIPASKLLEGFYMVK